MTPFPPPAEELRLIDAELGALDARRAQLLTRRAWLVAALYRPVPLPAPAPPRPETPAPRVQNVLLLLGGVLLTLAAVAFTLVSWGELSIARRAAVLGVTTLAVLAAPVALRRRGLRATAESVAGIGLALTALDAYALHATALSGTDATGYAAVATAVLALTWTGYGAAVNTGALTAGWFGAGARAGRDAAGQEGTAPRADGRSGDGVPGLRLPLPAALAVAQLPLLLGAVAVGAGPYTVALVLLLMSAADTVVAFRCAGGVVRVVALVGAYGAGAWAVLAALWFWAVAGDLSTAARAATLLALPAGLSLAAARRLSDDRYATAHALVGGLFLVGALGTVPHALLPSGWTVPVHLALGIALPALARTSPRAALRHGALGASAGVQGLALLCAVPTVGLTLLGPVSWAARVWSGAPADARAAVTVGGLWPPHAWTAPVVLVSVAAVLALAVRAPVWRPRALTGALCLAWAALWTLPAVLALPHPASLALQFAVTAALLLSSRTRLPGLVLALAGSVLLVCSALAGRTETLSVLAALTLLWAGACRAPGRRVCAAPAALVLAAALVVASGAAAHWPPARTALPLTAVAAVAALLAARCPVASRVTVPVEAAGAAAGVLAIGLAVPDPATLSLVLGLCGVIVAGSAARDGRHLLGLPATVLFVLAAWVRLAVWGVAAPEAYTLPVSLPALLVGAVRRGRDPRLSSWTAYGPGLGVTLLPSLGAAWADPHPTRPLLLGAAALLLTLLGARHRLRAPLLLGGAVLVLVSLHELAPYLVQLAGGLPRWVPPALAGLLLLAVGATYESRIRDVRRVREVLGRMS
ncbi:SCO7613 C-terminal domain-containing membrane protein [Streptomyces sp. NPDC101249]|uniref:SCO7613 C-terminal domain-containing membrane protein n=1 Tax=Streptomyces sp. NPDC101249 TaxID=3366140 RepID=UPI0037F6F628